MSRRAHCRIAWRWLIQKRREILHSTISVVSGLSSNSATPCSRRGRCRSSICARRLDLVALGTVADIVPLEAENRILVHHGMREIAPTKIVRREPTDGRRGRSAADRGRAHRLPARPATECRWPPDDGGEIACVFSSRTDPGSHCTRSASWTRRIVNDKTSSVKSVASRGAQNCRGKSGRKDRRSCSASAVGIRACSASSRRGSRQNHHRPTIIIGFDEQGLGKGSGRSIDGLVAGRRASANAAICWKNLADMRWRLA